MAKVVHVDLDQLAPHYRDKATEIARTVGIARELDRRDEWSRHHKYVLIITCVGFAHPVIIDYRRLVDNLDAPHTKTWLAPRASPRQLFLCLSILQC
jgi:hypothetical protein